ncbi:MAG: hypothetical protein Q9187_002529 [Circinaria calcarea]
MPTGMKTYVMELDRCWSTPADDHRRRQAMADQAAGQPQSPLRELPATKTRNRKEKKKNTEANPQSEIQVSPTVVVESAPPAPPPTQALLHVSEAPSAADVAAENPTVAPTVTMTVPAAYEELILRFISGLNPNSTKDAGVQVQIPNSTKDVGVQVQEQILMVSTATGASPVKPSKRTLDSDDTTNQPAPKRSRLYQAAPKVRKIKGTLNKDTGLIEGGAYTLDGQLVLTPYRPDTVMEISDDEARWPFDREKGRFNRNPLDLRRRPRIQFGKSTTTEISQAQTKETVATLEQNTDSSGKDTTATTTAENQSEDRVAVTTGAEIQPLTEEQPAPVTPRQWGFTNLARSVSRFVPRLPFSGNRSRAAPQDLFASNADNPPSPMRDTPAQTGHINTNGDIPNIQDHSSDMNTSEGSLNIQDQAQNESMDVDNPTKTADESNSNVQRQPEDANANVEERSIESDAQHDPHTEPRQFRNRSNPDIAPATSHAERRQGRTQQTGWKSRAQKRAEKEEKERKILLAENKRLIDEEVARRVTAAMREEENRRKAEGADATGKKRKRYSPDVIPNPKGCSYGMDLDYFGDSSSDDEAAEEDTPTKPSKRARVSPRNPSTPPRKPIGDLTKATPYTGITFADPRSNLFDNVNTSPPVVYIPTPSITFEVPYDSDSFEEEESDDNVFGSPAQSHTDATAQNAISTIADPGPPPPRPNPSHATLPSTGPISSDTDALARARSQALRYTPRQPSGLRASSRLSSSTVASDIGNEQPLEDIPEFVANDQNEIGSDIVAQQGTNEQMDPEVTAALASIPDSDLIQFDFPKAQTYADAGIIDPEVQAYLDSTWTLEDEEQAGRVFESNFAAWSAQQSPILNSNLVT